MSKSEKLDNYIDFGNISSERKEMIDKQANKDGVSIPFLNTLNSNEKKYFYKLHKEIMKAREIEKHPELYDENGELKPRSSRKESENSLKEDGSPLNNKENIDFLHEAYSKIKEYWDFAFIKEQDAHNGKLDIISRPKLNCPQMGLSEDSETKYSDRAWRNGIDDAVIWGSLLPIKNGKRINTSDEGRLKYLLSNFLKTAELKTYTTAQHLVHLNNYTYVNGGNGIIHRINENGVHVIDNDGNIPVKFIDSYNQAKKV